MVLIGVEAQLFSVPLSETAHVIRALAVFLAVALVTLTQANAETVFIRSGQHEGQGWIFQHESGCWVATAGHVVIDGVGVIVVGPNGKQAQAVRIVRHTALDLALLELAGTTLRDCPASSLGDRDELAMLDRLLAPGRRPALRAAVGRGRQNGRDLVRRGDDPDAGPRRLRDKSGVRSFTQVRPNWTPSAASSTSTSTGAAPTFDLRARLASLARRLRAPCARGRRPHPLRRGANLRRELAVAASAGRTPCRAAGNAMAPNPIPIVVPCHRVLRHGREPGRLRRRARVQALAARPRVGHPAALTAAPSELDGQAVVGDPIPPAARPRVGVRAGAVADVRRTAPARPAAWAPPPPHLGHRHVAAHGPRPGRAVEQRQVGLQGDLGARRLAQVGHVG